MNDPLNLHLGCRTRRGADPAKLEFTDPVGILVRARGLAPWSP